MKKIELLTIMSLINVLPTTEEQVISISTTETIYALPDLRFNYGGDDDVQIQGKIPLPVMLDCIEHFKKTDGAKKRKKYFNCMEAATCDELEQFSLDLEDNKNMSQQEKRKAIDAKRQELIVSKLNDMHICTYFISSKERFIFFIATLGSYYRNKDANYQHLVGISVDRYEELLARCNEELYKMVNLYQTTGEWLNKNALYFLRGYNRYATKEDEEIRHLLEKYDEKVNPFINTTSDLKPSIEYSDKLSISVSSDTGADVKMSITDINTQEEGVYQRQNDYLNYGLSYILGAPKTAKKVNVNHYFSVKEAAEIISVEYADHSLYLKYDITNGVIITKNGLKKPISLRERMLLIQELNKANMAAEGLILDVMCTAKPDYLRKHLIPVGQEETY